MRIPVTILFIFLFQVQASTQYMVKGRVSNADSGEPVDGAIIHCLDHEPHSTDTSGEYQFLFSSKGTYLLEVSAIGYTPYAFAVTINKDTIIDIALQPLTVQLSEIIITGVPGSVQLLEKPLIIKPIDRQYLSRLTSSNLIDALSNLPGINNISTGPGIGKPVVRGLGYNRVITLNNGIRQEGQQWGDEHGVELDEYAIDRIEIIKGPGSLMYGSDGIAGVLNFLAPPSPAPGTGTAQIISNYQSNNHLIGNSISYAGIKKGFGFITRFTQKIAGNYQNRYDGMVSNSGFREIDGNLFLSITKPWGHSYLRLNTWNNIINLPEGERDSTGSFIFINPDGEEVTATDDDLKGYKVGYPHQSVSHNSTTLNNYFRLKHGTLNIDLGLQNNKRREFSEPAAQAKPDLYFDLTTLHYNCRYNVNNNGWESSTGVSGMFQVNKNKGQEFLIPQYKLFDAGVFIMTQKKVRSKWVFATGLRFDKRLVRTSNLYLDTLGNPTSDTGPFSDRKFSGLSIDFSGFSGSAGISYLVDKTNTVKMNISKGYRAPNMAELASNGRHEGTFRYEIGNPGLKAENSTQIDIAYFHNTDFMTIELTPFVNYISNYTFVQKLEADAGGDSIAVADDPAPVFKFVQESALLYGGEIMTDLNPPSIKWMHLVNTFSFVRGLRPGQIDRTKNLPFIPAPRYTGELRFETSRMGKILKNTYLKISVTTFFPQTNILSAYQTESPTGAYTLLNAGIGTTIALNDNNRFLQILLNGENLADIAYQNHLSRLKYAPVNPATGREGIFNMGRNFSVKAIFTF